MRIHRVLVVGVVEALTTIFIDGKYADKAIEKLFQKNKKWGSRDRAFIAEQVYEIVRWWRLLHYGLTENTNLPASTNEAYWWKIVAINLIKQGFFEKNDWKEWSNIPDKSLIINRLSDKTLPLSVRVSIPDWLEEEGIQQFGKEWENEIVAMNNPAPLILRCNSLKTNPTQLSKELSKINIAHKVVGKTTPDAIILDQRTNVFSTELFKNGLFEVQDLASQLVAQQLQLQTGLRVIDACAGAGGKTLHISSIMQNKGQIIALDKEEYKLNELKKRAIRAGATNIVVKPIENSKTIKRLYDSADRLLLDVPCSGLGVLRRNPDAKWKLKPEFIENIKVVQQEIIQNYSKMLKNGGIMVYATCSIMPTENNLQVQKFLSNNPDFKLLSEIKTSPQVDNMDGFYMATLKKND
ncbi:MAG: class I SAM-dependent methyltransferase [Saprospiraceae bacterium]|nr:class I SAM-dependent methyltransferase [Saprospiraceae bacterium]